MEKAKETDEEEKENYYDDDNDSDGSAAGEKTETKETTETSDATEAKAGVVSTKDYNPDDYVTVGDYEGVEVTVDVVNFTDADVEKSFNEEVEYYVDYAGLYEYEAGYHHCDPGQ